MLGSVLSILLMSSGAALGESGQEKLVRSPEPIQLTIRPENANTTLSGTLSYSDQVWSFAARVIDADGKTVGTAMFSGESGPIETVWSSGNDRVFRTDGDFAVVVGTAIPVADETDFLLVTNDGRACMTFAGSPSDDQIDGSVFATLVACDVTLEDCYGLARASCNHGIKSFSYTCNTSTGENTCSFDCNPVPGGND